MPTPKAKSPAPAPNRRRTIRKPGDQFAMRPPNGTLTARISSSALRKVRDSKPTSDAVTQEWTGEAYRLVRKVPEAASLSVLKASLIADCEFRPVREVAGTPNEWEPDDDEAVVRVMRMFVGPVGGQAELKRRAALHLDIGGESILIGYPEPLPDDAVVTEVTERALLWEFTSGQETVIDREGHATRRADGMSRVELDPETYTARLHRADAEFSEQPDSQIRRALPIMQELEVLDQLIWALTRSRLAANILLVNEDITWAGDGDETPDGDGQGDEQGLDPFTKKLMEHLAAPINDRDDQASLVPLVLRINGAAMDTALKVIELSTQIGEAIDWARGLRTEALDRLAKSLDAPPEEMNGKGGLNHWTGYNISDDFIAQHIVPEGRILTEFVVLAYLRPMLMEFEGFTPEQAATKSLEFDPSPIQSNPDEEASARYLHEHILVSDDEMLRAAGHDPAAKPNPDEYRRRFLEQLIEANPAQMLGLLPLLPGFEDIDPATVAAAANVAQQGPGGPSSVPQGPPTVPAPTGPIGPPAPAQTAMLIERLAVASDLAVDRALERASGRLVQKAKGKRDLDPTVRDRLGTGRGTRLLRQVSAADLHAVGVTPDALLAQAWDDHTGRARAWIRTHLEELGVDPMIADERAALAASNLCAALDGLVKANLHRPMVSNGNGLRVPSELVVDALSSAGITPDGVATATKGRSR